MDEIKVKINGKEYKVKVEETPEGKLRVYHGDEVFDIEPQQGMLPHGMLKKKVESGERIMVAPLPGMVQQIGVKKGDHVKKGQVLLTLTAMKMENDIVATKEGRVKGINVKKGQTVNRGDILVELE